MKRSWFARRSRAVRLNSPRRLQGTFEALETRQLLAITSSLDGGNLVVTTDAADNIAITSGGGNVLINGAVPDLVIGSGAAASVTNISVTATGNFANTIDLSGVSAGTGFTGLPATGGVVLDGGPGADMLTGSAFGDRLLDGLGVDNLAGGAGDDTYVLTPGGSDIVNDTAGSDTVDFSLATLGVALNLDLAILQFINTAGDSLQIFGTIENFTGSPHDDTLTAVGLASPRTLSGGASSGLLGDRLTARALASPVTISATSLAIGGTINYDTFESATIIGQFTDDVFNINSTPTATRIVVDGVDGSDVYNVVQHAIGTAGLTLSDSGVVGNDDLLLSGNLVNTIRYNHTSPTSGTIEIEATAGAIPSTITYTGFEPIVNTGMATNIIFTLTVFGDTATLTDLGGGSSRLASSGSFEVTDFVNPPAGGSLAINMAGGADTLNITSLAATFAGSLTVNGDLGTPDRVNINTSLTLGGALALDAELVAINAAAITTAGSQTINASGGITVAQPLAMTANAGGTITIATPLLAAGGNNLTVTADEIDFPTANSIGGGGTLTLQPVTPALAINVGGAAAPARLDLTATDLAALVEGFTQITIGRANGTHAIDIAATSFKDNILLQAPVGAGAITVNGPLDTLASLDAASITLNGSAATTLNANVVTAGGAIAINDDVLLGTPATIRIDSTNLGGVAAGATVTITGTVNDVGAATGLDLRAGAAAIVVTGAIGNTTPIASLTTDAAGTATFANVATTGSQTYNDATVNFSGSYTTTNSPIVVNGATILAATTTMTTGTGAVTFDSTVNSEAGEANSLTVTASGTTTFHAAVGTAAGGSLGTLRTNGGGTTVLNIAAATDIVATTVDIVDALTLAESVVVNATTATFAAVDSETGEANTLTVAASGVTTFTGPIGTAAGGNLGLLRTNGGGSTVLDIAAAGVDVVATTVDINEPLVLNSSSEISATTATFAGTIDSQAGEANGLTVTASGVTTFNGAIGTAAGGGLGLLRTNGGGTTVLDIAAAGVDVVAATIDIVDALTLNDSAAISATTATFAAINSQAGENNNLAVTTIGATLFAGAIGAVQPLGTFTVTATGPLDITQNITAVGAINLTTADADPDPPADGLTIAAPAIVRSTTSSVTLGGGDAVTLAAGATVQAATTLTILGDVGDNDAAGAMITLAGTFLATAVAITGGNDADTITLNRSPAGTTTTVTAGDGDDTISLGTGTSLDTLLGPITVNGQGHATTIPGDTLNLNDSAHVAVGTDEYELRPENALATSPLVFTRAGVAPIRIVRDAGGGQPSSIETFNLTMGTPAPPRATGVLFNTAFTVSFPPQSFDNQLPNRVRVFGGAKKDILKIMGSGDGDVIRVGDTNRPESDLNNFQVNGIDGLLILSGGGNDTVANNTFDSSDAGLADANPLTPKAVPSIIDLGAGNDTAFGTRSDPAIAGFLAPPESPVTAGFMPTRLDLIYGGPGADTLKAGRFGTQYLFADHDLNGVFTNTAGDNLNGNSNPNAVLVAGSGDFVSATVGCVAGGGFQADVITWLRACWLPDLSGSGGLSSAGLALAQAEALKFVNWHANYLGSDLAAANQWTIGSVDAASHDTWYELTASQLGVLYANAWLGWGESTEIALFDHNFMPLAANIGSQGFAATSINVSPGMEIYVRLRGTSASLQLQLTVAPPDAAPPTVTLLEVHQHGADAAGGWHVVALGAGGSLAALPWAVDGVRMQFNESVLASANHFALTGLNVASYAPLPSAAGFTYDVATRTATWNLASPVVNDRLALSLVGAVDRAGNALAFDQALQVLSGDVTGDGQVNIGDVAMLNGALGATGPAASAYDLNGDGTVGRTDIALLLQTMFGTSLPSGSSPAASIATAEAPAARRSTATMTAVARRVRAAAVDQALSQADVAATTLTATRSTVPAARGAANRISYRAGSRG